MQEECRETESKRREPIEGEGIETKMRWRETEGENVEENEGVSVEWL